MTAALALISALASAQNSQQNPNQNMLPKSDIPAPSFTIQQSAIISNLGSQLRQLQRGRPTITGIPIFQNGATFSGQVSLSTFTASGSARLGDGYKYNQSYTTTAVLGITNLPCIMISSADVDGSNGAKVVINGPAFNLESSTTYKLLGNFTSATTQYWVLNFNNDATQVYQDHSNVNAGTTNRAVYHGQTGGVRPAAFGITIAGDTITGYKVGGNAAVNTEITLSKRYGTTGNDWKIRVSTDYDSPGDAPEMMAASLFGSGWYPATAAISEIDIQGTTAITTSALTGGGNISGHWELYRCQHYR